MDRATWWQWNIKSDHFRRPRNQTRNASGSWLLYTLSQAPTINGRCQRSGFQSNWTFLPCLAPKLRPTWRQTAAKWYHQCIVFIRCYLKDGKKKTKNKNKRQSTSLAMNKSFGQDYQTRKGPITKKLFFCLVCLCSWKSRLKKEEEGMDWFTMVELPSHHWNSSHLKLRTVVKVNKCYTKGVQGRKTTRGEKKRILKEKIENKLSHFIQIRLD